MLACFFFTKECLKEDVLTVISSQLRLPQKYCIGLGFEYLTRLYMDTKQVLFLCSFSFMFVPNRDDTEATRSTAHLVLYKNFVLVVRYIYIHAEHIKFI